MARKKRKFYFVFVEILLMIVCLIGASYAFFNAIVLDNREDNSNVSSMKTSEIPATIVTNIPDAIGSFTAEDIYPGHKEVLALSVTASGKKGASSFYQFVYDVYENSLGSLVKVSLYQSESPIATTRNYFNCEKKVDRIGNNFIGYEMCEDKNVGNLIESNRLTGGAEKKVLGSDGIVIENDDEGITKYYYVVIEYENLEEGQNEYNGKTLDGKISVEVISRPKDTEAPKIDFSLDSDDRTILVDASSSSDNTSIKTYYYSLDNVNWESSSDSSFQFQTTEDNEFVVYVKAEDMAGNISETSEKRIVIDKVAPNVNFIVNRQDNGILIDASSSTDNVGIKTYYYSQDGVNWTSSEDNSKLYHKVISYGVATETIKLIKASQSNDTYYVKVEDKGGNMSGILQMDLRDLFYDNEYQTMNSDNNLRYAGKDPNNYVKFNNELWRVIGVMNNIDDGNGNKESRIKLIRDDSFEHDYIWNLPGNWPLIYDESMCDGLMGGDPEMGGSDDQYFECLNSVQQEYERQMNETPSNAYNSWDMSDVRIMLDDYYKGSNHSPFFCPSSYMFGVNDTKSCPVNTSLSSDARQYISNAVWNLGSNGTDSTSSTLDKFYEFERSNNTGADLCTTNCSLSKSDYSTTYTAPVGLIYPSDFGFASGGKNKSRSVCLTESFTNLSVECSNDNWINGDLWTMMPESVTDGTHRVYSIYNNSRGGGVFSKDTYDTANVKPVVYLTKNVKIVRGLGTKEKPFELGL